MVLSSRSVHPTNRILATAVPQVERSSNRCTSDLPMSKLTMRKSKSSALRLDKNQTLTVVGSPCRCAVHKDARWAEAARPNRERWPTFPWAEILIRCAPLHRWSRPWKPKPGTLKRTARTAHSEKICKFIWLFNRKHDLNLPKLIVFDYWLFPLRRRRFRSTASRLSAIPSPSVIQNEASDRNEYFVRIVFTYIPILSFIIQQLKLSGVIHE